MNVLTSLFHFWFGSSTVWSLLYSRNQVGFTRLNRQLFTHYFQIVIQWFRFHFSLLIEVSLLVRLFYFHHFCSSSATVDAHKAISRLEWLWKYANDPFSSETELLLCCWPPSGKPVFVQFRAVSTQQGLFCRAIDSIQEVGCSIPKTRP